MASPLNVTDSNGYVHGYCQREEGEGQEERERERERKSVCEFLSNYSENIWLIEDTVADHLRVTYYHG